MNHERPLGPLLDDLGVTANIDDNDRLTEVLVIGKLVDLENGNIALLVSSNDLDWVAQWGLHGAAAQVFNRAVPAPYSDDDDDA